MIVGALILNSACTVGTVYHHPTRKPPPKTFYCEYKKFENKEDPYRVIGSSYVQRATEGNQAIGSKTHGLDIFEESLGQPLSSTSGEVMWREVIPRSGDLYPGCYIPLGSNARHHSFGSTAPGPRARGLALLPIQEQECLHCSRSESPSCSNNSTN